MTCPRSIRPSQLASRRGGTYVAVLGTASLVMTIGVAAIYAAGVRRQTVARQSESADALIAAQSTLEASLSRLGETRYWTSEFTSGVWNDCGTFNGGVCDFQVVYDAAEAASAEWVDAVVRARTVVGGATRTIAEGVELAGPSLASGPNLVAESGFETGLAGWFSAGGSVNFDQTTDTKYEGSFALRVNSRDEASAGIYFDLTGLVSNGDSLDVSLRIRSPGGKSDGYRIVMQAVTDEGTVAETFTKSSVGDTWVEMSGTVTATWSGTLTGYYLEVESVLNKDDFYLDDVWVTLAAEHPSGRVRVDATTWAREVSP